MTRRKEKEINWYGLTDQRGYVPRSPTLSDYGRLRRARFAIKENGSFSTIIKVHAPIAPDGHRYFITYAEAKRALGDRIQDELNAWYAARRRLIDLRIKDVE